jgi:hypothetical protein
VSLGVTTKSQEAVSRLQADSPSTSDPEPGYDPPGRQGRRRSMRDEVSEEDGDEEAPYHSCPVRPSVPVSRQRNKDGIRHMTNFGPFFNPANLGVDRRHGHCRRSAHDQQGVAW